MKQPQNTHWIALKRLLRYLHGTMQLGLQLHRSNPLQLHAFSDADWGSDKDNYLSTSGYLVYLGKTPIAWCPKKQKATALSSTEAEFRAVAAVTSEILWVSSFRTGP
ncbi:secreted RxLR effector protein 161-like [Silene latifolia]|uniref:secreted RxLR effector protein 161-like n=1 Tax=Silene latifolia TaxID=37657 RepID=UPI003D78374C